MTTSQTLRILITAGEPAGIGPDIIVKLAQSAWPVEICVIGDPALLNVRAKQLNLPLSIHEISIHQPPAPSAAKQLNVLPIACGAPVVPGQLNTINATYVIATLQRAAEICMNGHAHAIVTAPIQKSIMNDAGISFSGHTEFFAHVANVKKTVMLFVVDNKMKVALATTHLPLKSVSAAITPSLLQETVTILHSALTATFKIDDPKIAICGLNPHAGERGHLGVEEIEVIAPFIQTIRQQGYRVTGPWPADTIFTPTQLEKFDAILCMYHDQALPVVKYAGFGQAVNMTLGLPFIRTSVDHGTALDIAGTGKADAGSLIKALELAIQLSTRSLQHSHSESRN